MNQMTTLIEIIDEMTSPGVLVEKMDGQTLRCLACAHRCVIHEGRRGICRVRFNREGLLQVPHGYVAGLNVDPIEKKPFNHFLPGSGALTFGMLGCNFHCEFCQNWLSSQVLRDASISSSTGMTQKISAKQIMDIALNHQAGVVASSYNEPVITAEWAHEVFSLAKTKGLKTVMISNGYSTRECLEYLRPVMDGYKIDLKSMQDKNYRGMGGQLKHVLDSIQTAHDLGLWVEVVTLVIPGFNDSPAELWDAARAIVSVSPEIPWHVTGFHPDYDMQDTPPTRPSELQQAADIGQEAGLKFVYAGNLPGRVGSLEDTHCPACNTVLIKRRGYAIGENKIMPDGTCPSCRQVIPGVWK
jgi:pyruvate formate lyase activating enzyme